MGKGMLLCGCKFYGGDKMKKVISHTNVQVGDPPIAKFLFGDTRMAWVWLIVRLYLAADWLQAGWAKFTSPAWTVDGSALKGFWAGAVAVTPKPVIYFDWYRQFIQYMIDTQSYVWFAKLIVAGELLIGVCLLLGAFIGIAAFFGGFMNWNFLMAGSSSVNPVFFALSIGLILAWKVAGHWGLDRFLLPMLGTPWRPALVLSDAPAQPSAAVAPAAE
jgi:thiosulfate dehydrogenase [quinone] large subunit